MAARRRATAATAALAGLLMVAVAAGGCVENQFALRVRSQDPIAVSSPGEPVERAREGAAVAPTAAPFADRGVILQSGFELRYRRDGDWIASEAPVVAASAGDTLRVAYTLHPGRRDLPVLLTTPTGNVCELLVRSRTSRGLAYASLIAAGSAALFASITALSSRQAAARDTAIGLGAGAGALAITGVTLLLWPPYGERALVENGCR